jgi:predicted DNA-binding transcriptional regulator AlpA
MTQQKRLLTSRQLCVRYSVSDRTLHHWLLDQRLGFPRPLVIRRRRYWDQEQIDAFDRAQAAA